MDFKIFRALNQFTEKVRFIDVFMIFISQKLRFLYALILIILWCRDNHHKRITLYAGISAFLTWLVTYFIKLFFFKPRPYLIEKVNLLAPVPSKNNSSFPSKHTTLAFALSTSILLYKHSLGRFMSLCSFLAGFSRIWMGQHYPSDIIGSALIGSFIAICVNITACIWKPFITKVISTYHWACGKNN